MSPKRYNWKSFEEARAFVRKLKLKNAREWRSYIKNEASKPIDIPNSPNIVYKEKGWIGFGDWLGTSLEDKDKEYLPYNSAKVIVNKMSYVKSIQGYKNAIVKKNESIKKQFNASIPVNPDQIYKNSGWTDWSEYLGIENVKIKIDEFIDNYNFSIESLSKELAISSSSLRRIIDGDTLPRDITLNKINNFIRNYTEEFTLFKHPFDFLDDKKDRDPNVFLEKITDGRKFFMRLLHKDFYYAYDEIKDEEQLNIVDSVVNLINNISGGAEVINLEISKADADPWHKSQYDQEIRSINLKSELKLTKMLLKANFSIYISNPNGGLYNGMPDELPKKINLIYVSFSSLENIKIPLDKFMLDDITDWWDYLPKPGRKF